MPAPRRGRCGAAGRGEGRRGAATSTAQPSPKPPSRYRFKLINDTWGHALGDEVLRRAGAVLGSQARREDLVGRFGGEEFMVIVHDTPAEQAESLGDRFRESIRAMSLPAGPERVTVSVGVACWDGASPAPPALTLISRADEALYLAKREGRDRVRVYARTTEEPLRTACR